MERREQFLFLTFTAHEGPHAANDPEREGIVETPGVVAIWRELADREAQVQAGRRRGGELHGAPQSCFAVPFNGCEKIFYAHVAELVEQGRALERVELVAAKLQAEFLGRVGGPRRARILQHGECGSVGEADKFGAERTNAAHALDAPVRSGIEKPAAPQKREPHFLRVEGDV